jgi:hypothetical protein
MSPASANIDTTALSLGDVVVTGKGAKQIPLISKQNGEAVTWNPQDFLTVMFEPSAYNQPDATRLNLCLSVTPAVARSLSAFDEWLTTTLAAESLRLFGTALTVEEVRGKFLPTLRTHEATGSQSLRLKMNTTGRSRVRLWDMTRNPISAPPSWTQCSAKCKIRLKAVWLMGKNEMGVVAEVTDVMLDDAEAECPFA